MPNPVITNILNIWFVNTFCRYTVKWSNSSISNNSLKHKPIKLNGSKYCYVLQTIKYQLFVYTQLNDQTINLA